MKHPLNGLRTCLWRKTKVGSMLGQRILDLTPFPVLRLEPLLPLDHHLDGLSKLLQHGGLISRLHPP